MNIDDPKLTAYALDELDEAERAAIAQEVAASPEAHREIQETQMMARLLRAEFAAELEHRQDVDATSKPLSANLSDIHDDPWFWSIGRPLAIAAVIAIFAIVSGVTVVSLKHRSAEQVVVTGSNIPSAEEVGQKPVEAEVQPEFHEEIAATPAAPAAAKTGVAGGVPAQSLTKSASLAYS